MKKAMFVVALLAIPAVAFAGTATMSLRSSVGNSATVTVAPTGGSLDIVVWIDAVALTGSQSGVSNIDGQLVADQSNVLTITGRSWTGMCFRSTDTLAATDANIGDPDFDPSGFFGNVLAPSSPNFGVAATVNITLPISQTNRGTQNIANGWKAEIITLDVAAAGPAGRTTKLNFSDGAFVGTTVGLDPESLATTLHGMTIVQTPEPATMLLLAAALPFLRRRSA